jgi:amino acid adenylation domain-containing protein
MASTGPIFISGEATHFDSDGTLTALLRDSLQNPDHSDLPAAVSTVDSSTITYSELALRVNLLLRRLSNAVSGRESSRIAVCLDRSFDLVTSCCTCILGGFTYSPIHPTDPEIRKSKILTQLGPVAVVTSTGLLSRVETALKSSGISCSIICIDAAKNDAEFQGGLTKVDPSPDSIVYCTFTSGSTGIPKGIMLSQRALYHFVLSLRQIEQKDRLQSGDSSRPFGPGDRILQSSRVSFDIHFFELIGPILFGGATVLLPPDESESLSSRNLLEVVLKYQIAWAFMVPAVANQLQKALSAATLSTLPLKSLFVGGEAPSKSVMEILATYIPVVHNGYGPAECTIFSTFFSARKTDFRALSASFPIGKPLPGYFAMLGPITGEESLFKLWIGGPSVMSGYLRSDVDSTSLLVSHSINGSDPTVFYNTGDLVRVGSEGELVFAGRNDNQVKIRGQRIEIGDIEASLREIISVGRNAAAKVVHLPSGSDAIVAYLEEKIDENRLRQQCLVRLPPWMVPSFFEYLPTGIPMNQNRKIDRKALPPPSSVKEADVAIIGGGVAGIITAIACKQRGLSYQIFESAGALGGVWVNGAANQLSKLQQPFEYYMLDQVTEPPRDASGEIIRFPDTPSLVDYIQRVDLNNDISRNCHFNCNVKDVVVVGSSQSPAVMLTVVDLFGEESKFVFGSLVCATGRFQPQRTITPSWIPSESKFRVVAARQFSVADAQGQRVAIIGGGPYAVEALRLAVENGASEVTVINRSPRWVFPRSWFNDRTLTRLFWRLIGGLTLPPKLVLLAKIVLARLYINAGIESMIPAGLALTNPQTAISDEWFEYAKRPNVHFIRSEVIQAKGQSLILAKDQGDVEVDTVVVACGFQSPEYSFLALFQPLKMFLGSILLQSPNIGFVGVNLGEGIFSNPHTCRIQASMVLNTFQYPLCRRPIEYQSSWIESMPVTTTKDPQGSNTHLAEFLSELKFQTIQRSHHLSSSSEIQAAEVAGKESSVEAAVGSIADAVLGEHVPPSVPLLNLGMDSIRAIEFRSRLLHHFGDRNVRLPSVSTLLWDLPTVNAIVELIYNQIHESQEAAIGMRSWPT